MRGDPEWLKKVVFARGVPPISRTGPNAPHCIPKDAPGADLGAPRGPFWVTLEFRGGHLLYPSKALQCFVTRISPMMTISMLRARFRMISSETFRQSL